MLEKSEFQEILKLFSDLFTSVELYLIVLFWNIFGNEKDESIDGT